MCESMHSYQKHRLIFNCSTHGAEINDNSAIPYLHTEIYFAFKKVLMNFDKHRVVADVVWLAVIVIRINHI